jgi:prophage regulatory protein
VYIETKILRLPEVAKVTGLSPSTIRNRINPFCPWHDATFPTPIKLGPGRHGAIGWFAHQIADWLDAREKATDSTSLEQMRANHREWLKHY